MKAIFFWMGIVFASLPCQAQLYTFGSGEDGLQGRQILALSPIPPNLQEEGKGSFLFTVGADGTVLQVIPHPENLSAYLDSVGIVMIRKWHFSTEPDLGQQSVVVQIFFKADSADIKKEDH